MKFTFDIYDPTLAQAICNLMVERQKESLAQIQPIGNSASVKDPWDGFDLPLCIVNPLTAAGVTPENIQNFSTRQLLRIPGIGKKALKTIQDCGFGFAAP